MDTAPRGRQATEERSGGKIVRNRRVASYRTPYDRPTVPTPRVQPQSPNWLTGIVVPTSRMIANGATKILSSLFRPDTSSSSSSSSGSDSEMEDEGEDEKNDYDDSIDALVEEDDTSSKLVGGLRTESHLTVGKSGTKILVEKLLMQETFSRDEADRLMEIISSRVIDGSPTKEGHEGRLDIRDKCSKAVQEAKQWLEEKKVSSNSKLNFRDRPFNSIVPSQVARGESGSPVDMARSYMNARPPWASASVNYDELRTPSPMSKRLSNGEISHYIPATSFSSSKKMYSLGSGSWNIQEEIRKVRSKATENMLKTIPPTTADLPVFSSERKKSIRKSLLADKPELWKGEKLHNSKLLAAPSNIAAENSSFHVLAASGVETTHGDSHHEDILSAPVNSSAQNQDVEAVPTAENEDHAATNQPTTLDLPSEQVTGKRSSEGKSIAEPNANGFPLSEPSLSAGNMEPSLRSLDDDKNQSSTATSRGKLASTGPAEETCELLSETHVGVPSQDEETNIAIEEPPAVETLPSSEQVSADNNAAATNEGEKRRTRKVSSRYKKTTVVRGK